MQSIFIRSQNVRAQNFTSAGGHFNPDNKKHCLNNPAGPHPGDMYNFTVKSNGTAKLDLTDVNANLCTDSHSGFQWRGDSLSDPRQSRRHDDSAGNAGDRVACGTIKK